MLTRMTAVGVIVRAERTDSEERLNPHLSPKAYVATRNGARKTITRRFHLQMTPLQHLYEQGVNQWMQLRTLAQRVAKTCRQGL